MARTTKVVAGAALAVFALGIWRAFNAGPDCNATVTQGRVTFPFCNGEVAGASPRCFRWPMRLGRNVLDRLQVADVAHGGPQYEYGAGFVALRPVEANNPQQVIDTVLSKLDLDDADSVPNPDSVEEITCPGTLPRAAIVVRGNAQYDSECACSSGTSCTYTPAGGGPVAKPKDGNTMPPGTWSGAGCIPMPCSLMSNFPYLPQECR